MQRKLPPTELFGQRIRLRKPLVSDAARVFDLVSKDRSRLGMFLPWVRHVQSLEDEINWIKGCHRCWASFTEFSYVICQGVGPRALLGGIGIHTISWEHDRAELGYWIAREAEGQGYVAEAVGLLERALADMGFHRVQISCRSDNLRSIHVAERAGYHREAHLRHFVRDGDRYHDMLMFGKLPAVTRRK